MSAMFTLAAGARHGCPARALVGDGARRVERVHSDTRTLQPGDLFVALQGRALRRPRLPRRRRRPSGAVAAIAERGLPTPGLPGIEVDDTQLALGELAAAWRAQFDLPLIAVTGSNGKTTVTQMIAAILRAWQRATPRWPRKATSTTTSACR